MGKKVLAVLLIALLFLSACAGQDKKAGAGQNNPLQSDKNSVVETEGAVPAETMVFQIDTNGNLINGSRVVGLGDWLYCCMPNGIYRMRADGTENEQIYEEQDTRFSSPSPLILAGDWVYTNRGGIVKVRTDGVESQRLNDFQSSGSFRTDGQWLYLGCEYKLAPDGSNVQQINDKKVASGYTVNISDGWVYYYDEDENGEDCVYKFKTDGTQKEKIHAGRVDYMIVDGEWIYYASMYDDTSIYKMKTDGSEDQLVLEEDRISTLNLSGEWLYYAADNTDGETSLYRVKVDGTDKQELYRNLDNPYFNVEGIYIIGDWVYFIDKNDNLYRITPEGAGAQMIMEWHR